MNTGIMTELELVIMILLIEQMWRQWVFILITTFVAICNAATHSINMTCSDDDSDDNSWLENNHVRIAHLDRLLNDDTTCIEQLRMNRRSFSKLCKLLRIEGKLTSNGAVLIEEQVAMFLYILGHHKKNRIIKFVFMRSGETVSRNFNKVLNAVIKCSDSLLRAANPIGENCIDPRWKWFKGRRKELNHCNSDEAYSEDIDNISGHLCILGWSVAGFSSSADPYLLPIYLILSLGCYGLLMVGIGLMGFPTCPQEATLLQQDIAEAREFLKQRGVPVDVGSG